MQHPNLTIIIKEIKDYFTSFYQDKLDRIILYGSQARKTANKYSDIDILIVLKNNINPYQEIDKTGIFVSNLCLKYDVVISRHFISQEKFSNNNTPFLFNIRQEGINL
jgi:uncharacterized protein